MLEGRIQTEILDYYYGLWVEHPFKRQKQLKEFNEETGNRFDLTILEANAKYLIDKGLMIPFFTFGLHTYITLDGILHFEMLRLSPDPETRNKILQFIKIEYDKNPLDYYSVHKLAETLDLSFSECQRNIQILDHLGLIDPRRVMTGYQEVKINANGIDVLKQPTVLEIRIGLMSNAYSNLYRLESMLRIYLETTLISYYGTQWWNDGIPQKVREAVISNKQRDGGNERDINYTDFNHLKRIIFDTNNWKNIYEQIFDSQTGITGRLDELETVRNRIAHTRTLSNEEIIKLELYLREILEMMKKRALR